MHLLVPGLLSRGSACVTAGLTAAHPDPDRFHLDIVAAVAKLYLDGGRCECDGMCTCGLWILHGPGGSSLGAAFVKAGLCEWDYGLSQASRTTAWVGDAPDFALFWDFARRARGGAWPA